MSSKPAKNHHLRGHHIRRLKAREPRVHETVKSCMFVCGARTSEAVRGVMKDLNIIKKPHAVQMTRKHDMLPMEDQTGIEKLARDKDCGLFVFGNDNKKRPDNIIFGRMFDEHVLDMIETGIVSYESIESVLRRSKAGAGVAFAAPPLILFRGEGFANAPEGSELATFKSLLLDTFRGVSAQELDLEAIDLVLVFTSLTASPLPGQGSVTTTKKDLVSLRAYRADFSARTNNVDDSTDVLNSPLLSLLEHGPHIDFELRRSHIAASNLAKLARKQKKLTAVTKKRKNIDHDEFQGKIGHLHMTPQDTNKLVTRSRFSKAFKRTAEEKEADKGNGNTSKKAKTVNE